MVIRVAIYGIYIFSYYDEFRNFMQFKKNGNIYSKTNITISIYLQFIINCYCKTKLNQGVIYNKPL